MSRIAVVGLLVLPVMAPAEIAGPPVPGQATAPAARAMQDYAARTASRVAGRPCRRPGDDDITVCATAPGTTSPYRLPLPEERDEKGERRAMVGEMPRPTAIGRLVGSPPAFGIRYSTKVK